MCSFTFVVAGSGPLCMVAVAWPGHELLLIQVVVADTCTANPALRGF